MRVRSVVIIVLLVLFVTAIAQNTAVVNLKVWFWELNGSLTLMLLSAFGVGLVTGFLLGRPWRRRRKATAAVQPAAPEQTEADTES